MILNFLKNEKRNNLLYYKLIKKCKIIINEERAEYFKNINKYDDNNNKKMDLMN